MADVLLFHHAQGVTPGIRAFADRLGEAGHTVHVPDLFDGHTFASIEDGLAHVAHIGCPLPEVRVLEATEQVDQAADGIFEGGLGVH